MKLKSSFHTLIDVIENSPFGTQLISSLKSSKSVSLKGIQGSLKSILLYFLYKHANRQIVVLCDSYEIADSISHDCSLFSTEQLPKAFFTYPKKHTIKISSDLDASTMIVAEALSVLLSVHNPILFTTPESFQQTLPEKNEISLKKISMKIGDLYEFEEFIQTLMLQGFNKSDYVQQHGDIAVRGGIIDIYPLDWENPLRIEFWDIEVTSIREFDPSSQRSIRTLEEIEFYGTVNLYKDSEGKFLQSYLQEDCIFFLDSSIESAASDERTAELLDWVQGYQTYFLNFIKAENTETIVFQSSNQPDFGVSMEQCTKHIATLLADQYSVYICSEGEIHTSRFKDLFKSTFVSLLDKQNNDSILLGYERYSSIEWMNHSTSFGFTIPSLRIAVFTEHQVFNRRRVRDLAIKKSKSNSLTIRDLELLHPGDYVVHEDKGVGQFAGLVAITISGNTQESVKLLYADGDVLYVSLNNVFKLSKYASEESAQPRLTKLGSAEWEKKKSKAKKRLKDIARELIALYAERKKQTGFAFSIDSQWQKEFEASFLYEDTPDQATATSEVKEDMESTTPMDRLICGDVGFGKTEIAIRAAFKATQSNKQVAILVPTTILAEQHFQTFRDRLQRYPVSVEVLSRFRTKLEQKKILDRLTRGEIDILIGTHRILSADVQFKDLGLLVIDEEQRFGVGAKEKLRQMRASIDTLTLTATPIPRTLNFSLMGARDLSIIQTPPRNRLPIETIVTQWNDDIIFSAVKRELERKGQIFFVSDTIDSLYTLQDRLITLDPLIKSAVAHGQMSATELENIMERFLERKYDCLIATKIIESGLDIPNANTIFVHNAQNFGLAELYQMRGRVGRSNTQAYSYLLVPPASMLTSIAIRRLQALEEFTDLGSGFQLSLRDLEIRGAGNLLGAEQSGYILDMGFELYQKILDEAVTELRQEEFATLFSTQKKLTKQMAFHEELSIDLEGDALLPENYVKGDTERFDFYKRLYRLHNSEEIQVIRKELVDRYGALPPAAENLLFAVEVRIKALPLGFVRLMQRGDRIVIELPADTDEFFYASHFPKLLVALESVPKTKLQQKGKKLLLEFILPAKQNLLSILNTLDSKIVYE